MPSKVLLSLELTICWLPLSNSSHLTRAAFCGERFVQAALWRLAPPLVWAKTPVKNVSQVTLLCSWAQAAMQAQRNGSQVPKGKTAFSDTLSCRLTVLEVSHNSLEALPEEIEGCTSLVELLCSNNSISCIPESISRLQELKTLDLRANRCATLSGLCSSDGVQIPLLRSQDRLWWHLRLPLFVLPFPVWSAGHALMCCSCTVSCNL